MNLPPEHPRASTTDDVKLHDRYVKDVRLAWKKVCIELRKQLDRNLPFYPSMSISVMEIDPTLRCLRNLSTTQGINPFERRTNLDN